MTTSSISHSLFGGAIIASIPTNFADVSSIRQVPDNQEVFLRTDGFTSLTIDLCERVTYLSSLQAALEYHFSDIVAEGDAKRTYAIDTDIRLPNFPDMAVGTLMAVVTPPAPTEGRERRENEPKFVVILFALLRLEQQMTDVTVALNVPCTPGGPEAAMMEVEDVDFERGKYGSVVEEGKEVLGDILRSLEVKDWGMFGPGG
ncbi:uncharacterized protein KY384_005869 [Bacidia gigantensis]|uniref:uncharacterized protein n=1 Tax=Bacidia gigantensis TaxID=2732470 RepID=UPI001D04CADA|nr:uncharacterized protein KY384_005869 [Bacidia gigantensis]KAG8529234.1 hypothetical protein KY384_005869 [Bacidia gigantensis]